MGTKLTPFELAQAQLVLDDPRLAVLRDHLLSIGGVRVALVPVSDFDQLMTLGRSFDLGEFDPDELVDDCMSGNVELLAGAPSQCHANAAYLAGTLGEGHLVTGWALSDDLCWREHSWVLAPDGHLIETTTPRIAYFGYVLVDKNDISTFAYHNYHPMVAELYGRPIPASSDDGTVTPPRSGS